MNDLIICRLDQCEKRDQNCNNLYVNFFFLKSFVFFCQMLLVTIMATYPGCYWIFICHNNNKKKIQKQTQHSSFVVIQSI